MFVWLQMRFLKPPILNLIDFCLLAETVCGDNYILNNSSEHCESLGGRDPQFDQFAPLCISTLRHKENVPLRAVNLTLKAYGRTKLAAIC
jgi:hypothetical protein